MRRLLSVFIAVLLVASFLAVRHRAWLVRSVSVSVDLKFRESSFCQMFYTDSEDAGSRFERPVTVFVKPGGAHVVFSPPSDRLERIRFDFGNSPGNVRASPVVVEGEETRILDWRDFTVRHDIARFAVDTKGAVDIESVGGDPYAMSPEPLGLRGRLHTNGFVFSCLIFAALFVWWFLAGPRGVLWNTVPAESESVCTGPFFVLALVFVAARFVLVARIPAFFGPSPWDDGWFVNAAAALLRGEWLGSYDQYTLCKGCFGPMVAACASLFSIPFLVAETGLYVLGCAYFVRLLSKLVRIRFLLLAVFAFLLFNPASFSFMTWQRVYRNGMPLWQVPIVFGSLFSVYLAARGKIRGILPRALFAGAALWAFSNTREDAIWIAPFAVACLTVSAVRAWRCGSAKPDKTYRALACLLPIVVVLAGNAALCLVNHRVYGLPLRNDRDAGNYAKAMRDLYLIEPDTEEEARLSGPEHADHHHNIYYSTLCKAYDESPTLRGERRQIDQAIDDSAKADGYSERDLHLDHMLFAIRLGIFRAGHYASLPESEAFWGNVHKELDAAFRDGRLRRRGFSVTAMSAPLRSKFVPRICREWFQALRFVSTFGGTEAVATLPDLPGQPRSAYPHMVPVFGTAACETTVRNESLSVVQSAIARANVLSRYYSSSMSWIIGAALAAYACLSVLLALGRLRTSGLEDWWLFATGILASILVHTACIGYVSATTFGATSTHYLAASYQLALMFVVVVAGSYVAVSGKHSGPSKREIK